MCDVIYCTWATKLRYDKSNRREWCQRPFLFSLKSTVRPSFRRIYVEFRQFPSFLLYSFVTSRVDYWNSILASVPKKITHKLQRVQNATARLITGTKKHERGLSRLLLDDLHWLTIPQRVQYKLAGTVHRCFRYRDPRYPADCSNLQHLHSASRRKLNIPRFRHTRVS